MKQDAKKYFKIMKRKYNELINCREKWLNVEIHGSNERGKNM